MLRMEAEAAGRTGRGGEAMNLAESLVETHVRGSVVQDVVYHGSRSPDLAFGAFDATRFYGYRDEDRPGIWFSRRREVAEQFVGAEGRGGVIEAYLRLVRPLVVFAHGLNACDLSAARAQVATSNGVDVDVEDLCWPGSTWDWLVVAAKYGMDGAVFHDVDDPGGAVVTLGGPHDDGSYPWHAEDVEDGARQTYLAGPAGTSTVYAVLDDAQVLRR